MAVALQTIIFPKNNTSNGNPNGLVNSTSQGNLRRMQLPMTFANGSDVYLGDPGLGYPPSLYPNLTHPSEATEDDNDDEPSTFFNGQELWPNTTLILGPYPVNESFFLMSMTVAVRNSTTPSDVLGWMTVVLDASLIYDAIVSPEGLQQTGQILIVAPTNAENLFRPAVELTDPTSSGDKQVRYAFPPQSNSNLSNRHASRALQRGDPNLSFPMRDYPAVVDAWTKDNEAINNAGAIISTRDEDNARISVGYAAVSTSLVDWILLFEQSYDEVMAPVHRLRDIVLACVFGTTGVIMILLFPVAHFAVRPIRHLREATSKTSTPILPDHAERSSSESRQLDRSGTGDEETVTRMAMGKKEGFLTTVSRWKHGAHSPVRAGLRERGGQTGFKIPGKVPERQPWIKDELSDLTSTFNEMSDELVLHYARLEERVKERTAELEESKKAAESANASKTLFIANISHELKTPLNGILGMCAVCMQEEDIRKIRQSLSIIYKSGDLLLHLLTDLLTFSKNSIGQQLTIDTGEFKLLDVSTQVASIFERQAKEGEIDLQVEFLGTCDALGNFSDDSGPKLYGPAGTGRVKDMWLWGDKNRILQVLINLVSNSLKFTPATGSVHVRINCIGLAAEGQTDPRDSSRRPSIRSKQSRKSRSSWNRRGRDSDGSLPTSAVSLDNCAEKMDLSRTNTREINVVVAGEPKPLPQVAVRQRSPSPAPLNTKVLMFEFAITDTGPGIPEEQMSRIFEPFVQGDLGLSKKYAGTGLGLSICAQLASLMGGNITLQSTVGVGSTFTVKLPLRYVSGRRASTSSSPARIGNASPSPSPRPSTSRRPSLVSKPGSEKQVLSQNLGGSVGGNAGVAGGGSVGSSVDSSIDGRRSGRKAIAPASKNDGSGNDTADQPAAAPLQDLPRIVGFSQPFIAGGDVISPASRSIEAAQVQSPKLSEIKRAENKAAKKGEKVRVLVAEDNKVNQEVVTRMLKLESVYGEPPLLHVSCVFWSLVFHPLCFLCLVSLAPSLSFSSPFILASSLLRR